MIMLDETPVSLGEFTISITMKVLGFLFDNKLKWNYHVNNTINKTKSVLHSLRKMKRFLTKLWFSLSSYNMERNHVRSVYYSPVRLKTSRSHWTPRAELDRISGRATCDQWHQFCLAKQMIRIQKSKLPSRLYESNCRNSYCKNGQMGRVFYYIKSNKKTGLQSLFNRLKEVSDSIKFDWLNYMSLNNNVLYWRRVFPLLFL